LFIDRLQKPHSLLPAVFTSQLSVESARYFCNNAAHGERDVMEDSAEKIADGVGRLLFGPVQLVSEFLGSVVPGLLLLLLLTLKHNDVVQKLFANAFLGYRSKLVLGFFVAYIFGKMLNIPAEVVAGRAAQREEKKDPKQEEARKAKSAMIGGIVSEGIYGKYRGLDFLSINEGRAALYQSSGIALLLASSMKGDGLRLFELVLGVLMVAAGYYHRKATGGMTTHFVGMSFFDFFSKIPLEHWTTAAKLMKSINEGTGTQQNAQPNPPSQSPPSNVQS
jgi:hypothetical protein